MMVVVVMICMYPSLSLSRSTKRITSVVLLDRNASGILFTFNNNSNNKKRKERKSQRSKSDALNIVVFLFFFFPPLDLMCTRIECVRVILIVVLFFSSYSSVWSHHVTQLRRLDCVQACSSSIVSRSTRNLIRETLSSCSAASSTRKDSASGRKTEK